MTNYAVMMITDGIGFILDTNDETMKHLESYGNSTDDITYYGCPEKDGLYKLSAIHFAGDMDGIEVSGDWTRLQYIPENIEHSVMEIIIENAAEKRMTVEDYSRALGLV